jgi:hypothetical protein
MKAMEMSVASVTVAVAILAMSIGCVDTPAEPSSFTQEPNAVPAQNLPVPPPLHIVPTPSGQTVPASNGSVPGVQRLNVAMSHSGTATVSLNWQNGDFSLQMFVTKGVCADASGLVTGACAVLGTTRPGSRPGVVTTSVVSGDVVTVWVLNPDAEGSQTFTVGVEIN